MNKKAVFKLMMLLIVSLLVITGCNKQAKIDEADAERIAAIEEKVDALLNEDKDDIVEGVEEKQFDEINELLADEEGKEFSEENALRIGSIVLYLNQAENMLGFQNSVSNLVDEDEKVNEGEFLALMELIVNFKDHETFYERQTIELDKVEELYEEQVAQAEHVEKTEKALAKLFTDKDKVKSDVTQKQHDEVAKLVKKVADEEVKTGFEAELKKVDKKIKAIAKAEKEEAERKAEEERQLALQKEQEAQKQQANSVQSNQSATGGKATNKGNTTNKSSNKQTASGNSSKGTSNSSKGNTNSSAGSSKGTASKGSSSSGNTSKGNSGSSGGGNKGSDSNNSNSGGGMSGQDIADMFNNADCEKVKEYEFAGGGHTGIEYNCK